MAEFESNGICAEKRLLEGLEKMGFKIERAGDILDEERKIDAIIHAPPLTPEDCYYPPPVGLQITLRREDIGKRTRFFQMARSVVPRLVYLELAVPEVTSAVIRPAAAALAMIFYDEGPAHRLLVVGENFVEMFDLENEDNQARTWLANKIPGTIEGEVFKWMRESRYGYIRATVPGIDGTPTCADFHFRAGDVKDRELGRLLDQHNGTVKKGRLNVTFQDWGAKGSQKNKSAVKVNLLRKTRTAAPPSEDEPEDET